MAIAPNAAPEARHNKVPEERMDRILPRITPKERRRFLTVKQ
jgi:hypothetical protein